MSEWMVLVSENAMKKLIAGYVRGQISEELRRSGNYRDAAITVAREYLHKYGMDDSRADCYTPNELAAMIFENDSKDVKCPNLWMCKAMKDDHI